MKLEWKQFLGVLLAGTLLFCGLCSAGNAPKYSFIYEATSAPPTLSYDYIIIGGGTAGCPLAATLSQGANVLVLERGGSPYGNQHVSNMANFGATLTDTSPTSPSQPFISQDGVYNNRARVLGGGSCLNAGFYTRAESNFVKKSGWDEQMVRQSYEWVEKKVAFQPPMLQWQSAVRDGLLEAGVLPNNGYTFDHNYGTKVGGTIFDHQGHRHTAADLLEYADPKRINVYLHASVHKILFNKKGKSRPQANGVIFKDAKGAMHTAILAGNPMNEIIVSAGALGSPQLLMLSGIGPGNHLRAHGIEVVMDHPMVGQGMADNPMNALYVPSPQPVETSLIQVVGITRSGSYIETSSGANLAYSWIRGFLGSNSGGTQDINPLLNASLNGGMIMEKIIGPKSTGHLELQSTNPEDNPAVTFNYFNNPEDLSRCVEGMNTIINVINSKALSKFRYATMPIQTLINMMATAPLNRRPRHLDTAFSLEQFCIDTVMTIWHYHGGCQLGKVVDSNYRVLGVDALRVIDGSTFYDSPGTNPQATVMMLGRYMGQRILQERSHRRR